MKPYPKHQPLYFTPRTPWGTRLTGRTFYDHMKASENGAKQPVQPVQPVQPHPNILQKVGSGIAHGATGVANGVNWLAHGVANGAKGLVHAISSGHPTGSVEVRKEPGAETEVSGNIGWSMGAKNAQLAPDYPEAKQNDIRAVNQSWGMKVPADENSNQESTPQASPEHVTTDQELEAGQRAWAKRNPDWVNQKVKTGMANLNAPQARTNR